MKLYVYFNGEDEFTNSSIELISPYDDQLDSYTEDFEAEEGGILDTLSEIRDAYPVFYSEYKEKVPFVFAEWPE